MIDADSMKQNELDGNRRQRLSVILVCLLSALAAITICSKSSPIYPFNDWQDANCYFTVGKSILAGVVPYRDLFEQKGPFIYFIHAAAALISRDTFFGMYLIETVFAAVFLYWSYKSVELFCGRKAIYTVPFLALVVFTSRAFCHGDSAEELCAPFLAYTVFVALKAVRNRSFPADRESIMIGISAACVFWTKFSLCGLFAGWFAAYAIDMLIHKKWGRILRAAASIAAGLVIGTLPWILYFGIHHAAGDWLEVYIYDNLFIYSNLEDGGSLISRVIGGLYHGIRNLYFFIAGFILMVIGGIYCVVRRWIPELLYSCAMFALAFFVSYVGGRSYQYYAFFLAPFVCLGFVPLCSITDAFNEKKRFLKRGWCWGYLLLLAAAYALTPNRYLIGVEKKELPQYQFAEIISETENATLLNYGFLDGGFYTTTGIIPNCRSFCELNIPLVELRKLQDEFVAEGKCDYVVTRSGSLDGIDRNRLYSLVSTSVFFYEGSEHTYYLYRLTSLDR